MDTMVASRIYTNEKRQAQYERRLKTINDKMFEKETDELIEMLFSAPRSMEEQREAIPEETQKDNPLENVAVVHVENAAKGAKPTNSEIAMATLMVITFFMAVVSGIVMMLIGSLKISVALFLAGFAALLCVDELINES